MTLQMELLQVSLQKQHYIAWSSKRSSKPIYKLLTSFLSADKTNIFSISAQNGFQSYFDTSHSKRGVWILVNYKDLLEYIQSWYLSSCSSI